MNFAAWRPTHVYVLRPVGRDLVIHLLVVVEVEGLEGVEQEVSQVLIHVDGEDPPVEAVDGPATVHHLRERTLSFRPYIT